MTAVTAPLIGKLLNRKERMSKRRIANVSRTLKRDLADRFPWLMEVDNGEHGAEVQIISVSVFDHWLSREEACEMLENIPPQEQARRDALLADFCSRMIAATEVMSFVQRGRASRRMIFRKFLSNDVVFAYCRPHGGRIFGHRHFHVLLPELGCAFYESWDDTYHFFFTRAGIEEAAGVWARESGVFLLDQKNRPPDMCQLPEINKL